mmetsp:Transcript_26637/g.82061  ORF Transcript_26637/g.82061 Transcript_26637/m.82061 type:complete len:376 (+) Transcript_26637:572-1699(+)
MLATIVPLASWATVFKIWMCAMATLNNSARSKPDFVKPLTAFKLVLWMSPSRTAAFTALALTPAHWRAEKLRLARLMAWAKRAWNTPSCWQSTTKFTGSRRPLASSCEPPGRLLWALVHGGGLAGAVAAAATAAATCAGTSVRDSVTSSGIWLWGTSNSTLKIRRAPITATSPRALRARRDFARPKEATLVIEGDTGIGPCVSQLSSSTGGEPPDAAASSASLRRSRLLRPKSRPPAPKEAPAMMSNTPAPKPRSISICVTMMLATPMRLLKASKMELTVPSRPGKQTSLPSSQEQPHAGTERPMTPTAATKTPECSCSSRQKNAIKSEAAMNTQATPSAGLYKEGLSRYQASTRELRMEATPQDTAVQEDSAAL